MGTQLSSGSRSGNSPHVDVVSAANLLDKAAFYDRHVQVAISEMIFPEDLDRLSTVFETSSSISDADLSACFDLVKHTSAAAYKSSNKGWSGSQKREELREPNMKFLIIRRASSNTEADDIVQVPDRHNRAVEGFVSFMITREDEFDVLYCYEIHLQPSVRGKGVGAALMLLMERIGLSAGVDKSMLTVFVSNQSAISFYNRLGYAWYDEEPVPPGKKLRRGKTAQAKPTYVILAKAL